MERNMLVVSFDLSDGRKIQVYRINGAYAIFDGERLHSRYLGSDDALREVVKVMDPMAKNTNPVVACDERCEIPAKTY